jgi:hypothetical protein
MSRKLRLWETIQEKVKIRQKDCGHTPLDKLQDAFMTILAGGCGVYQVNTLVRSEPGLQGAFGRAGCAEQSSISRMLNKCTPETVEAMRAAQTSLVRTHSRCYKHDYAASYLLLDVDITGLLAGRQAEGATKGYFANAKNRRGRQVGRVLASQYDEIVLDRLYSGKSQLEVCLQALLLAAEAVLQLDEARRKRTIIRVDGGGGRDEDINWLLGRGYKVILKVKNWQRTRRLHKLVTAWDPDPRHPHRQLGWVEPPFAYVAPTLQVATAETYANGRTYQAVIVTNLPIDFFFASQPPASAPQPCLALLMHFYDLRSGGIETSNRNSKSGLHLNHRNKRSFAAQEMLLLLAQLAYNLLAWVQVRLAQGEPTFRSYGWQRIVRDLFQIPGRLSFTPQGELLSVQLSRDHPLAKPLLQALSAFPELDHLPVLLRKI